MGPFELWTRHLYTRLLLDVRRALWKCQASTDVPVAGDDALLFVESLKPQGGVAVTIGDWRLEFAPLSSPKPAFSSYLRFGATPVLSQDT